MNVTSIVGARPQFVKAAVVSRALAEAGIRETLVHTGQHYDANMSAVFFTELGLPEPQYHLGIHGGSHGAMTGAMLAAIEQVLITTQPDWVLVYGDTNSTLAGALAAVKLHIPVAHVEAGLRSRNRRMPEEINRILTDHAADLLLTPTDTATRNLAAEGIPAARIEQVGDVMFDAVQVFGPIAAQQSNVLARLGLTPGGYTLATIHRAETTDDPVRLAAVLEGLRLATATRPVVLPLHPRTRLKAEAAGLLAAGDAAAAGAVHGSGDGMRHHSRAGSTTGLLLIEPVGYFDMLVLETHAAVVATDSGGVQKEAFFAGVPCVTLRNETEWVELVDLGWNTVVPPTDAATVAAAVAAAAAPSEDAALKAQPYGAGDAAVRVAAALKTRGPST